MKPGDMIGYVYAKAPNTQLSKFVIMPIYVYILFPRAASRQAIFMRSTVIHLSLLFEWKIKSKKGKIDIFNEKMTYLGLLGYCNDISKSDILEFQFEEVCGM